MPSVASLSEFNRNQSTVIAQLKETEEPLYLTRNGRSSVVVMDADAFDRMLSRRDELREREMAVYSNLLRGYQDVLEGRTAPAPDAFARIRDAKGW